MIKQGDGELFPCHLRKDTGNKCAYAERFKKSIFHCAISPIIC